MRNLLAENTLQDKLIKDVRSSRDILLAERSRQPIGADIIKIKVSTLLETAVLTWAANETINIKVDMAPDNGILSVWNFLWQFFEYDAPTPTNTWHWPDEVNEYTPNFGKETFGALDGGTENLIHGSWYTTNNTGFAKSITVYLQTTSASRKVKCAIYAYVSGGNAGVLVGVTEERTISAGVDGWETFNFDTKPFLNNSTNYYLVAWSETAAGNCQIRADTSVSGKLVSKSLTYGTFPNPLTGESSSPHAISIYATLERTTGQDFSINETKDWAKSADGIGRRNLFFRIKNLTNTTKYGVFAIKGYVFDPKSVLITNINIV